MKTVSNREAFQALQRHIPGGVNSPFRAFQAVGGTPPIIARGQGPYIWDIEGQRYLDFCCAWGPLMLGHSHPHIRQAALEALEDGSVFGASTLWELELAQAITQAYPSMEQVRLVNSGAEAVASALRLARGASRKARIIKFEGCYHGHVECLDAVGSEAEQMGGALALGASPGSAAETLVASYNDPESLELLLKQHHHEVAAVIIEPIPGSMALVAPLPGYLAEVRRLCRDYQVLLIFDEVLSGCRVALGGAQELLGVVPDITCLGKALAGGLPVGAFGASQTLMSQLAPLGTIYQAGTFCGNPLTVRCALANLAYLSQPQQYQRLSHLSQYLLQRLQGLDPELQVVVVPGMFGLYFSPDRITNHRQLEQVNLQRFAQLYHHLLQAGMYLPPSCLDAAGISLAHEEIHLDGFAQAVAEGLSQARSKN